MELGVRVMHVLKAPFLQNNSYLPLPNVKNALSVRLTIKRANRTVPLACYAQLDFTLPLKVL